jgi:hypothetical protein
MKEQPETKKRYHDDPLGIRAAISDVAKSPLIIRHIETHLVYGPIYRETGLGKWLYKILIFFLFGKSLSRYGFKERIVVSFIILKGVLGFLAFIFLICSPFLYIMGAPDALADGLLGLIWLPGIEFIPKITPKQKYITLSRIILTIPCIYMGINSGNWGW